MDTRCTTRFTPKIVARARRNGGSAGLAIEAEREPSTVGEQFRRSVYTGVKKG